MILLLLSNQGSVVSGGSNIPALPRWYYRGRPKSRPVIN